MKRMAETEREKSMSLVFKDLPMNGDPIKLTLEVAKPVKTGQSKYGEWYLWFARGEKLAKVHDHENKDALVEKYSGRVSFFPTEKMNEELIELCAGKLGVEVTIKKVVEEGQRGLFSKYVVEKVSDGQPPKDSLTPTELKLVKDAITLQKSGFTLTEKDFIRASQTDSYQGKITETRAQELFIVMQSMK